MVKLITLMEAVIAEAKSTINEWTIEYPKYSFNELVDLAEETFSKIEDNLNRRFIGGYETCLFAASTFAKQLDSIKVPYYAVSGDYNDYGHWWIEDSDGNIFDLGNNVDDDAMETGHIKLFINKNKGAYVAEDRLSPSEFEKYYKRGGYTKKLNQL